VASDKEAGRQIKCPNCFAAWIVPEPTYIKMRRRVYEKKQQQSSTEPSSTSKETKEPSTRESREYLDEEVPEDRAGFFDIRFDETVLFTMSFMFLLLFVIDSGMRQDLYDFIWSVCGASGWTATMSILFLFLPFGLGMVLTVFHAFSEKNKSSLEEGLMLFFAVAISAGTGIYIGWYILRGGGNILLILFGICNLVYSVLLIYQFERIVFTEKDFDGAYISGRNATMGEILSSSVSATILLLCCKLLVKFDWIISYSICITYATSLERQIRKLLVKK
jgi:hypothetical protein